MSESRKWKCPTNFTVSTCFVSLDWSPQCLSLHEEKSPALSLLNGCPWDSRTSRGWSVGLPWRVRRWNEDAHNPAKITHSTVGLNSTLNIPAMLSAAVLKQVCKRRWWFHKDLVHGHWELWVSCGHRETALWPYKDQEAVEEWRWNTSSWTSQCIIITVFILYTASWKA